MPKLLTPTLQRIIEKRGNRIALVLVCGLLLAACDPIKSPDAPRVPEPKIFLS